MCARVHLTTACSRDSHEVLINTMQVVWGKPARPEWGQALEITPHTVHALSVEVRMRHAWTMLLLTARLVCCGQLQTRR